MINKHYNGPRLTRTAWGLPLSEKSQQKKQFLLDEFDTLEKARPRIKRNVRLSYNGVEFDASEFGMYALPDEYFIEHELIYRDNPERCVHFHFVVLGRHVESDHVTPRQMIDIIDNLNGVVDITPYCTEHKKALDEMLDWFKALDILANNGWRDTSHSGSYVQLVCDNTPFTLTVNGKEAQCDEACAWSAPYKGLTDLKVELKANDVYISCHMTVQQLIDTMSTGELQCDDAGVLEAFDTVTEPDQNYDRVRQALLDDNWNEISDDVFSKSVGLDESILKDFEFEEDVSDKTIEWVLNNWRFDIHLHEDGTGDVVGYFDEKEEFTHEGILAYELLDFIKRDVLYDDLRADVAYIMSDYLPVY